MDDSGRSKNGIELLKVQNTRKPEQMISLFWNKSGQYFVTRGLRTLFGIKEIRIDAQNLLSALPEYAELLSFLLETMSTADDLHLSYGYQNEFEFGGKKYTLYEDEEYRVLKSLEE